MGISGFNIGALNLGDLEIFLDFINEQEKLDNQQKNMQVKAEESFESPFTIENTHETECIDKKEEITEKHIEVVPIQEKEAVIETKVEENSNTQAIEKVGYETKETAKEDTKEDVGSTTKKDESNSEIEKLKLQIRIKELEVEKLKLEKSSLVEEKNENSEEKEQTRETETKELIENNQQVEESSVADKKEEISIQEVGEQREEEENILSKQDVQKSAIDKQERIKELLRKKELLKKIREEKQRKERVKTKEEKNEAVEDYSKMQVKDLFEEVKLFMIQNGVQYGVMRREVLDTKFGQNNITKLIMQNYLILSSKGVTIGR